MWNLDSNISLYTQIIDIIKEKIISGEYPISGRLPSVRELAKEAGVNPNTMQRALSKLEETGLVKSMRTSGRFVTEDEQLIKQIKIGRAEMLSKEYIKNMQRLDFNCSEIETLIKKLCK